MTSEKNYQIYADELYRLGHGLPLWEPAPVNCAKVQIGDVGFIREGSFIRLFNSLLDEDDPSHTQDGVPEGFESLDLGAPPRIDRRQPFIPQVFVSQRMVSKGADVSVGDSANGWVLAEGHVAFETSSSSGAALITKHKAYRENCYLWGIMKRYALKHCDSWVAFANRIGYGVRLEDVLLVTGHDLTSNYAMAAFSNPRDTTFSLEFSADVPTLLSAKASAWGSWKSSQVIHKNMGPQIVIPEDPGEQVLVRTTFGERQNSQKFDQCIFLRRLMIRRRKRYAFLKRIEAAAGPKDLDGPEDEDSPPSDEVVSIFERENRGAVADFEKFQDPLEPIFFYIFENSDAEIAVAKDKDLEDVFQHYNSISIQPLEEETPTISTPEEEEYDEYGTYFERISKIIRRVRPELIIINGVGEIRPPSLIVSYRDDSNSPISRTSELTSEASEHTRRWSGSVVGSPRLTNALGLAISESSHRPQRSMDGRGSFTGSPGWTATGRRPLSWGSAQNSMANHEKVLEAILKTGMDGSEVGKGSEGETALYNYEKLLGERAGWTPWEWAFGTGERSVKLKMDMEEKLGAEKEEELRVMKGERLKMEEEEEEEGKC